MSNITGLISIANVTNGVLPNTTCTSEGYLPYVPAGSVAISPVTNTSWKAISHCCDTTIQVFQEHPEGCIAVCPSTHQNLYSLYQCLNNDTQDTLMSIESCRNSTTDAKDNCYYPYGQTDGPVAAQTHTGSATKAKFSLGLALLVLATVMV